MKPGDSTQKLAGNGIVTTPANATGDWAAGARCVVIVLLGAHPASLAVAPADEGKVLVLRKSTLPRRRRGRRRGCVPSRCATTIRAGICVGTGACHGSGLAAACDRSILPSSGMII